MIERIERPSLIINPRSAVEFVLVFVTEYTVVSHTWGRWKSEDLESI